MAAEKGTGQADQPGRSARLQSLGLGTCTFPSSVRVRVCMCMVSRELAGSVHGDPSSHSRTCTHSGSESPLTPAPSIGPMAGWCLWEKTSRHQMGAGGGSTSPQTKLGPPFTRLWHREAGRLERQGPGGRGQTEALARGHTGSCHCLPSWALSVVTRIGDRGVGLTSAAAMASSFPRLQRPDPSSLWPEKPRPPSPPRLLSPGMRGRRQWLPGQRCSGGAWVAWLLGGGARSAGQRDGDATGGLAARVGLLG